MSLKRFVFVFVFPFIAAYPAALTSGALAVFLGMSAKNGGIVALVTGVFVYVTFARYVYSRGLFAGGKRIDT